MSADTLLTLLLEDRGTVEIFALVEELEVNEVAGSFATASEAAGSFCATW